MSGEAAEAQPAGIESMEGIGPKTAEALAEAGLRRRRT